MQLTVTGTRRTGHRKPTWYTDLFAKYLGPFARSGAHFYIGGAKGIDSLTLLWLAEKSEGRITIVAPGTIAEQPAEARQAIAGCCGRIDGVVELGAHPLRTPAFHARNRWMVDRSDMVVGFPLEGPEGNSGTWQTLNYCAYQSKPRLIVPV
ncbi:MULTISPECIES: hypothetical protein [Streptomyces]|uniref:hypothetical protein n=1 Tax=Streptomyces TaxID=1883 RepID=UPI000372EAC6|nr:MULTISPECIES: hypothetical protein [Streptomyces]